MAGSSQGIMIGDSVLSLIDSSLPGESSSPISATDYALQSLFPSLGSLTTPVKVSKTSLKTYNEKWERDPLLRTWIARHPTDPGKVVCCFCNSLVRAHKNDLLEHTRTVKHQRNYMPNVSSAEYKQFLLDLNELKKEMKNLTNRKICSPQTPSSRRRNSNGNNNQDTSNSAGSPTLPFDWENSSAKDELESQIKSLEGDHDDVDGIMMDSPSDLVSVVLEEDPVCDRETVTIQPVTSKVKHKRRVYQASKGRSNGNPIANASANKHMSPGLQHHSISSAQNFLKLLNAVQTDPLSLNELLLLKKSIDGRINSLTVIPKTNQAKISSSSNSNLNLSKISLDSISKNNGITITSMGVSSNPSNPSSSRKRIRQPYVDPTPISASVKTEMIDVTPDVSDYLNDDMDDVDSYLDEQFTD